MVSQHGQDKVIEQALELCPSEKMAWSTGQFLPQKILLFIDREAHR